MNKKVNRRDLLKTLGAASLAPAFMSFTNHDTEDTNIIELLVERDDSRHKKIDKPLKCIILGAGNRGWGYSSYTKNYPEQMKVIGIAEPVKIRQEKFKKEFQLDDDVIFDTWEDAFKRPKFADIVVVSTIDKHHYGAAMKAMEMGYHVLLEKAIAQSWKECQDILNQAKKYKRIVGICHVLRYSPYFLKMHEIMNTGKIGDIVSIQHLEPIGNIHFSHSFTRGNWGNEKESTPSLLSKSCHDLDLIYWLLGGKSCKKVSSFGSLNYFNKKNAPKGSTLRCTDGCSIESSCPYSAPMIYLRDRIWGVSYLIDLQPWDEAKVLRALQEGPYGRCVFQCDNDVVDHQVVNMEFDDGISVAFSMEGHSSYGGRRTRVMGTKGDLVGDEQTLKVSEFETRESTTYKSSELNADITGGGHGGGDWGLVKDFLQAVYQDDISLLSSTIEDSMESHFIGFSAEKSRKNGGKIINL